MFKQNNC